MIFSVFSLNPYRNGEGDTYSQNSAVTKEAASIINISFTNFLKKHPLSETVGVEKLIPYMNIVSVDAASQFTARSGNHLQRCSKRLPCIRLHNGGVLQYDIEQTFEAGKANNAIFFNFDPDGNGSAGRISLYQYADGKLITGERKKVGTNISNTSLESQEKDPDYVKEWFK